jgi:hypothetical protein
LRKSNIRKINLLLWCILFLNTYLLAQTATNNTKSCKHKLPLNQKQDFQSLNYFIDGLNENEPDIKYDLIIKRKDRITEIKGKGNVFTEEIKGVINSLVVGDYILIDNIRFNNKQTLEGVCKCVKCDAFRSEITIIETTSFPPKTPKIK